MREELVGCVVWVGKSLDGVSVCECDQCCCDLIAGKRELEPLVAHDTFRDASDEASHAVMPLCESARRVWVADCLVPEVDQEEVSAGFLGEHGDERAGSFKGF